MTRSMQLRRAILALGAHSAMGLVMVGTAVPLPAQGVATIRGHVTDRESARPLAAVTVSFGGTLSTVTNDFGAFTATGVPAGTYLVTIRRIGYAPLDTNISAVGGPGQRLDVALAPLAVSLGQVSVTAASRQPERIVDAPAAISAVEPAFARDMAATGQTPLLVANLPGVHAMQSGVYDFNLNARGFNSALSRNVLVLVDGRDVSVPLLGNQDWAGIAVGGDGMRVEMVRGPGSALYGANALSGVLTINSPAVRAAHDSRFSVTAGELATARVEGSVAALTSDVRFGYRMSAGRATSGSWDVSRTNTGDLQREYVDAGVLATSVRAPAPGFELTPLYGQSKVGLGNGPGVVTGTADPVTTTFGSLRADYYPADGSVVTAEGGSSRIENPVNTIGVGRSQVLQADRPWARLAWTADAFSLMTYYSGRTGKQVSLGTGTRAEDVDGMIHTEGQFNRHFAGDRGRLVLGGSVRALSVDSRGTLFSTEQDGRSDLFYASFGQMDYALASALKFVVAGRIDRSTLDDWQFSPKLALVFKPGADQSVRVTFNRGFRAPSIFERFLDFPAGPPLNLTALEQGLRASPLGPALAGVPAGTLFTQSDAVPLLALGNKHLAPQGITSWELGYKGESGKLFVTTDAYYSRITDFTSVLLTGVNSDYRPWTAPPAVAEGARPAVEGAVRKAVAGLTRLANGASAYVLSYGNEGRATEWGAELGFGATISPRFAADGNYALHRWSLERATLFAADTVSSNTPQHTVNFGVQYHVPDGVRARIGFRFNDTFYFRDFQWSGTVPSSRTVDFSASRPLGDALSVAVVGTNVLNEQRFQLYGGSVIGRRLLATLTWKP